MRARAIFASVLMLAVAAAFIVLAGSAPSADCSAEAFPIETEQQEATPLPVPEAVMMTAIKADAPPAPEPEAASYTRILTDEEVELLAELMTCEAEVVRWDGVKYGVTASARIAAVGWVALNRYDAGDGATLEATIKRPHQFAWHEGIEASDYMRQLAADIADRYTAEKNGAQDVGRTIPIDYLYFHGDGRENYFRKTYEDTGEVWDWSLPDPYAT